MTRTTILTAVACTLAVAVFASPQEQKGAPKTGQGPIAMGDTVLTGFQKASYLPGIKAVATGPDTRMDSVDRERKTTVQLLASSLQAFVIPKSRKNEAERVEAEGNVRFSGERTLPDGTKQHVKVTGSKGVFHKVNQTIKLEGGITYFLEQPSADKKSKVTVTGKADLATYDLELQVLKLQNGFELKYDSKEFDEPAELKGKSLTANLGKTPPEFQVENFDDLSGRTQFKPKPAPEKPKAKPGEKSKEDTK